MTLYRTGTVEVEQGSREVTGVGTEWYPKVTPGSILVFNGMYHEILSIGDDTNLTLTDPSSVTYSGEYLILMAVSNANNVRLLRKINEYLDQRQIDFADFVVWMSGTDDGGPNSDGLYPVRDINGNIVYIKSPTKIAVEAIQDKLDTLNDLVDLAEGYMNTLNQDKPIVLGYRDDANDAKEAAETAKDEAEAALQAVLEATPKQRSILSAGEELVISMEPFAGNPSMVAITLDEEECELDFQVTGLTSEDSWSFTLLLVQGTGSNKVKWPNNTRFAFGMEPVLAFEEGASDVVTFVVDPLNAGGWLGFHEGSWFE